MLEFPANAISRIETYGPPLKGINSRWSPFVIGKDQAVSLSNYQVNGNGCLETYPGYTLDGSPFPATSNAFIRSLFDFKRGSALDLLMISANDTTNNVNTTYSVDIKQTVGDGTYQYFGHTIGTAAFTHSNTAVTGTNTHWSSELKPGDKIKATSEADSKYTEILSVNSDTNLTLVAGGYLGVTSSGAVNYIARKILNNANIPRFTAFNNLCIITNGSENPQSYDGSSVNLITNSYSGTSLTQSGTTAPNAKYVLKHKNRLFMSGTSSNPSRLFWSHAFDQTYWDPNSFEDIFPQDGGSIVSINVFADSIIVFKNTGLIYQVVGNFDDSAIGTVSYIRKLDITDHLGIISERSPVIHNNALYFMCQTGIYKIDTRMYVQKISFVIDPIISAINFSAQTQVNKSYLYNSQSLWNSGTTENGFFATPNGILNSFFDQYTQSDAWIQPYCVSIAIGTDNTIHIAYVQNSNHTKLQYVRYKADGTLEKEDPGVSTTGNPISFCHIGVSPADQTVGIAFASNANGDNLNYVERTPDSGLTLGTWGSNTVVAAQPGNAFWTNLVLKFQSGGSPAIAVTQRTSHPFNTTYYTQRNSGTWIGLVAVEASSGASGFTGNLHKVAMLFDGSNNIYVSAFENQSTLDAVKSTNGGATWSLIESFSMSIAYDPESSICSSLDHSGNYITTWSDGTHVYERNHGTMTTTQLDSGQTNPLCRGYFTFFDSNDNYPTGVQEKYLCDLIGSVGSQSERFTFDTSNILTNPTSNVQAKASPGSNPAYCPSGNPFVNNGRTTAMAFYGTSANQIIIRRICFKGSWASPVQSDATLTSWGNIVVNGITTNGNTIVYSLALNSSTFTPNPTSYSTVIPPALISSNSNNIYISAQIAVSLTSWAGISVTSLVLNYVGAGVDASEVFGVEYFNELYFANKQGGTSNNGVLVQDISDSYLQVGYPVNCMEMLGITLYGGSSLQGDLYKLRQGFLFNGTAYTSTFISKEDFLGNFEFTKDLYKIYVIYEIQASGSFTFSYRLDNFSNNGGAVWVDTVIDQTGITSPTSTPGIAEIYPIGKCRSIQFKITNNNNNQLSGIVGWSIIINNQNLR